MRESSPPENADKLDRCFGDELIMLDSPVPPSHDAGRYGSSRADELNMLDTSVDSNGSIQEFTSPIRHDLFGPSTPTSNRHSIRRSSSREHTIGGSPKDITRTNVTSFFSNTKSTNSPLRPRSADWSMVDRFVQEVDANSAGQDNLDSELDVRMSVQDSTDTGVDQFGSFVQELQCMSAQTRVEFEILK